jgi:hypothetical protein
MAELHVAKAVKAIELYYRYKLTGGLTLSVNYVHGLIATRVPGDNREWQWDKITQKHVDNIVGRKNNTLPLELQTTINDNINKRGHARYGFLLLKDHSLIDDWKMSTKAYNDDKAADNAHKSHKSRKATSLVQSSSHKAQLGLHEGLKTVYKKYDNRLIHANVLEIPDTQSELKTDLENLISKINAAQKNNTS